MKYEKLFYKRKVLIKETINKRQNINKKVINKRKKEDDYKRKIRLELSGM